MKAVIFDIGGVVVHDKGLKESVQNTFSSIEPERLWIDLNDAVLPACRGENSLANCWRNLAEQYDLEVPEEKLQSLWIDDFREGVQLDHDVLGIIEQLRTHYLVGVISNTIEEHAIILGEIGAYSGFQDSDLILSHRVGMTKDNPEIFNLALERFGVLPSDAVFIDDVPRYVQMAEKVGLRALHFTTAAKLKSDLLDLGLQIEENG